MTQTVIYNRNGWKVTSYGNGWAYCLEYLTHSVWFQGDDAYWFRENTMDKDGWFVDNCEDRFGDYSDIMTETICYG